MSVRSRPHRLLFALGSAALLVGLAACAPSADNSGENDPLSSSTEDQEFDAWSAKFDACMSENGIDLSQFRADSAAPGSEGSSSTESETLGAGEMDIEAFVAAQDICIEKVGEAPTRSDMPSTAEINAHMLAFAACMREAGYDFPDPDLSNNGMTSALSTDDYDVADVDACDAKATEAMQEAKSSGSVE